MPGVSSRLLRRLNTMLTQHSDNPLTGELIVTGTDMHWRKTLARHKAEALISRWCQAAREV